MDAFRELAEIFKDKDHKTSYAIVQAIYVGKKREYLRAKCLLIPENQEIIAEVSTDSVGGQSITLPSENDLVIISYTDEGMPILVKKAFSEEDQVPENALEGDTVVISLKSKKMWITSENRINLSKGATEPTENLVLGQIFKSFTSDLLTIIEEKFQSDSEHAHIGNLGVITGVSNKATEDVEKKEAVAELHASPIDDSAILSDIAYTEKGS